MAILGAIVMVGVSVGWVCLCGGVDIKVCTVVEMSQCLEVMLMVY